MDPDRTVKVVVGYLEGDRKPAYAGADLVYRTAFVLDSYRASKVEMYFDSELYASLLEGVRRIVRADHVIGHFLSGECADLRTPDECRALLLRLGDGGDDEGDPFERVVFTRATQTVAVAGHEAYWKIGGPYPYHDSFTIPVYTREDLSETLIVEARAVCARIAAQLTGVVRGRPVPRRPTAVDALRRVWQFFLS